MYILLTRVYGDLNRFKCGDYHQRAHERLCISKFRIEGLSLSRQFSFKSRLNRIKLKKMQL